MAAQVDIVVGEFYHHHRDWWGKMLEDHDVIVWDLKLRKLVLVLALSSLVVRRQQAGQGVAVAGQKRERGVWGREPGECVGREEGVAGKFNK